MESTDAFFEQVVQAIRVWSEMEVRFAIDPLTHKSYGLTTEESKRLIAAFKPISESNEFHKYMERAFMKCIQEVFVHIDGMAARSSKIVNVVNLNGFVLSQDLHNSFGEFLESRGYIQ